MTVRAPYLPLGLALALLAGCPPKADTGETDTDVAVDTDTDGGDTDTDTNQGSAEICDDALDNDLDGATDCDDHEDCDDDLACISESLYDVSAIVATVSDDYTSASLSTVDLNGRTVTNDILPLSTDPGIVVDHHVVPDVNGDGKEDDINVVFLLAKYGSDSIRYYNVINDTVDWSSPAAEWSTGEGSNPHDVEVCDDKIFVSLFGGTSVAIYDWNGNLKGSVDLSSFADADGLPEVDTLQEANGYLYVAMNELDETTPNWAPSGPGKIAQVDCAKGKLLRSWDVGPNPSISLYGANPGKLIVRTGIYYDTDYSTLLDGGLAFLDTTGDHDVDANELTEADLGGNITNIATRHSAAIISVEDTAGKDHLYCVNLTKWSTNFVADVDGYVSNLAVDQDDEVWASVRPTSGDYGILTYDLNSCSAIDSGYIKTTLPPTEVAFY